MNQIFAPTPMQAPKKCDPFFKALQQAQYGTLVLTLPNGVRLIFGGKEEGPFADWQVHDWDVFEDFIARGELGFADSYRMGRWDSSDLEALALFGMMNAQWLEKFLRGHPLYVIWLRIKAMLLKSAPAISRNHDHYELDNDFFRLWLDESMSYSCGLFEGDERRSLEAAQQAKYERILSLLGAKPGQHILDMGCGWGGFAEVAAKRGMKVTAVTLAPKQVEYAREKMKKLGLDHLVKVEVRDYRKVKGMYDHIVSIDLFEHVGEDDWTNYFRVLREHLKPGGKTFVQTIVLNEETFAKMRGQSSFIEQYMYPGGALPCESHFCKHAKMAGMACVETNFLGKDYALTSSHWLKRFNKRQDTMREMGHSEAFIRLWRLHMASCIAASKMGYNNVLQAVLMDAEDAANLSRNDTFSQKAA